MPEDGYHLSKDLADQAIRMIRDNKASNPSKPWFTWFCPGANHAPHHAPQEYIDKFKGAFDDGYEAYREWVLEQMIAKGVFPEGTKLTPMNPMPDDQANAADYVKPWDTLSDEERQLFCRMAEVCLCIGRDSADAVAKEYAPETQGRFTGGTIQYVEVTVEEEQYRDLEREMAAALAVD